MILRKYYAQNWGSRSRHSNTHRLVNLNGYNLNILRFLIVDLSVIILEP